MKTYQLDRFEGELAVLVNIDDASGISVKREELPEGAKECDVIHAEDGRYTIDPEMTEAIRKQTEALFEMLRK